MRKREEIHKKIVDVMVRYKENCDKMRVSIMETRSLIKELLETAQTSFTETDDEKLFNLASEQLALATRAMQYCDSSLKYLDGNINNSSKFKNHYSKMHGELSKYFSLSKEL